ncbi:hypothetical protein FH972_024129 [Carpinus fangiana]|uniref:Pre-mRNA-splicing factor SLU7 n=1 Tax=Carpinus fangiana TaxID=176857 RepID=A0A5N6KXF6_9ROSI|nr:hypothetical protein FH972_024129 [Carpinus fangiana]
MASRKPSDQSAAGKTPNEYIPSFITKKPFYVDDDTSDADYLEHQRLQSSEDKRKNETWYDRGKKLGPAATKFRKGACENCGAMTHNTKDCLSRPRKNGARWTGKDIQADENVQDVRMGWDAKRDRWNGFDASEYRHVVDEYNQLEDKKTTMDGEDAPKRLTQPGNREREHDGDHYEEETDMGRKQATSGRNLRLREDTAKYLLDLDLDSAKYDPKTRSMLDAGATGDATAELVAEDNFMRASGDATEFENAQRYAWETQERGDKNKLHLQANPTSGEYFRRKEKEEAETKKAAQKKALLELYGGQDDDVQKQLRRDAAAVVESEQYVEYDERGRIKGAPKQKAKSSYAEDVKINNHTSTWGSWWSDFKWGYACCCSTVKNSYCTGEDGRRAFQESEKLIDAETVPKQIAWEEEAKREEEVEREEHVPNAVDSDKTPKKDVEARKRTLKEMQDGVAEDELEQYRRRKVQANDPMAKMLGRDELLHVLLIYSSSSPASSSPSSPLDAALAFFLRTRPGRPPPKGEIEAWNVPNVALLDQHTGVVDGLGEAELVDTGLQAALQEVLDLEGQHVIELHAGLVEHTDTHKTANERVAFEETLGILLIEGQKLTVVRSSVVLFSRWLHATSGDILPGSTTDLGEGEHDAPHLTLVAETIFADGLQLTVLLWVLVGGTIDLNEGKPCSVALGKTYQTSGLEWTTRDLVGLGV